MQAKHLATHLPDGRSNSYRPRVPQDVHTTPHLIHNT